MNPFHRLASFLKSAAAPDAKTTASLELWQGRIANDGRGGRTDLMHAVERGYFDVAALVDVNYPDRSATTILAGGSGE